MASERDLPSRTRAKDTIAMMLLLLLQLHQGVKGSTEPWLKSEKHAELGTEVQLPCILKSPQCEGLHSIKWYRGTTRIFIFSEDVGITRGNNDIAIRSDIEYTTNSSKTYLKIPDVKLEDEGLYKCEATYMAVNRECNNVQHIILNVTVQPPFVRVIDENTKSTLSTGATLGPINEGSTISLYCESGEGKPVPTVEWFKDDQPLEATSSSTIADSGIGNASSLLQMQITRDELDATFTCKVNSIALPEPLTVDIKLDVHVRPLKMDLSGVIGHVVQGTKILLECTVRAARPAANVTWQNGTEYLNDSNDRFTLFETKVHENPDGTSETISHLAFTASEYDNGRTFKCYAENSVTRSEVLKPMKESMTIEVLYPPIVSIQPENITVNETEDFIIFCDYEANPASLTEVIWFRDDKELVVTDDHYEGGITEQTALTVKNATLSDMGSYRCILHNNVGPSVSEDVVEVNVLYKPVVEVVMDPETPVNEADRLNVSLTCEVVSGNPASLTAVRWYLDGDLLKELPDCTRNNTATTTTTEESLIFCDIDPSKLLLEAVGRSFHGNYSCEGRNDAGWGPLSASAPVIVYFPPENMTISKSKINVTVDTIPETVTCNAKAHPEATFRWFREGSTDTIIEGRVLDLKIKVPRRSNGTYYCEAANRHGSRNISMIMNVQFKPECRVEKERIDGVDYVVCSAIANPKETDFFWSLKSDNDTLEQVPDPRNGKSYIRLDTSVTNFRTYVCVANNTIGQSNPCERDVPAHHGHRSHIPWWYQLEGYLLLIVIVAAVVMILVIILICVAIFIVCRRKRNQMKYHRSSFYRARKVIKINNNYFNVATFLCTADHMFPFKRQDLDSNRVVELEEREHPDGGPPSPTVSSHSTQTTVHPTPAPRWPLKPGVLVHINRSHSLRSGLSVRTNETLRNELMARQNDEPMADRFLMEATITKVPGKVFRRRKENSQRSLTVSSLHDEGMLARANKIKAMFGVQLKEQATLPGISREKTAVTYKRITPRQRILHAESSCDLNRGNISRKRKKPGADPNQAANNNHVNSVSEGLPESGAKTFYENLPFHGIQAPPNKLVSPMFARVSALHGTLHRSVPCSPCTSRPPSRTVSLCDASSGYESTRSHLGPHYSDYNVPRNNSPVLKYNSLKPRRRKHKRSQFYSLRLCRRHENHQHRKYQLYAIPIYKCPHKNASTSTIATIVRSDTTSTATNRSGENQSSQSTPPPVPAPRKCKKTDPSKHTYQNVPPPVFPPKNASLPRTKTDSLYNYKEHYQQQHRQEMQQYSYPLPSNSSSQLTLPLTRSLYHSSIVSPLQTSFVHTNSRPPTLTHHETSVNHLSTAEHPEEEQHQQNYANHDARQSRRHGNRANERGQKYRKHKRGERKQKARRAEPRRTDTFTSPSCETSFHQVQELGIPETYKISYPHYYEDDIAECPTDYHRSNPSSRQQIWERQPANRCPPESTHYAETGDAKNRNKSKRMSSNLGDGRSPSAPTIMQYAELHFRDVGQEIDV
uniref:uncharacterized protein LOC117601811 isoform X7 n=1 Tax=Osmia lignaria TaxID=473952 RepID=UPI0014791E3A|nr:uncharacterized protein LOC117601811 isoform X7 [Osmia lignaria]